MGENRVHCIARKNELDYGVGVEGIVARYAQTV